jgi:hypothetical protein
MRRTAAWSFRSARRGSTRSSTELGILFPSTGQRFDLLEDVLEITTWLRPR